MGIPTHPLLPAHHRGSLSPWGARRGCVRWMFQEAISVGRVEQGLWASGGHRDSGGLARVLLQSREGDFVEKDILEWEPTGFRGKRPLGELGRAGRDLGVPPEEGDGGRVCPPPQGLPAAVGLRGVPQRFDCSTCLSQTVSIDESSAGCELCRVCTSKRVPEAAVTVCQRPGASAAGSRRLKAGKSKVEVPAIGFGESPLAALQRAALAASSRGGEDS